jgi:hypothetical protein
MPAPEVPVDAAATAAWALILRRLSGDSADPDELPDDAPAGRILGWLVEICAAGLASREHDLGASWETAFKNARKTAAARLAAAKTAPDLQALAQLAGASALRRAPRPVAGPRRTARRR